MRENFDCTQLISFNLEEDREYLNYIVNEFRKIGFEIILDIRNVKKVYFNKYIGDYLIELKDDNFMGEFEDWEFKNQPTQKIKDFISVINKVIQIKKIRDFTVMLTSFAEQGDSNNEVVEIDSFSLQDALFIMSRYNFDFYVDNLILKIND